MKAATIGVYENYESALRGAKELKENNFTDKEVSIIWKREYPENEIEKESSEISTIEATEVGIGVSLGTILGLLSGIGIFAIPGLGFIYGAGAIVGALAGIEFGLIGGGLVGALSIAGMKKHHHEKYDTHLKKGHFLLIVQGDREKMTTAKYLLHTKGDFHELNIH